MVAELYQALVLDVWLLLVARESSLKIPTENVGNLANCVWYGGLDVQNHQKSIFRKKYPCTHSEDKRPVHLNAIAAPEFISNTATTEVLGLMMSSCLRLRALFLLLFTDLTGKRSSYCRLSSVTRNIRFSLLTHLCAS